MPRTNSSPRTEWGQFPVLTLTSACSLVLVAIAYAGSHYWTWWSQPLFWAGWLLVLLPITTRIVIGDHTRQERIALLLVAGLSLYLIKVMFSPHTFEAWDELQHVRTATDILRTGRLFATNPNLPVSSSFPGLENVTTALVSVSGMTLFQAGVLVIGAARLVMVLALYLLYESISNSRRIPAIAVLLYMSNPHFPLFDAQFAYESLAIPLAVLTLLAAVRYTEIRQLHTPGLAVMLVLCLEAVTITHHVTSYVLSACLSIWAVTTVTVTKTVTKQWAPIGIVLLSIIGCLAWLATVGHVVVPYLQPVLGNALRQAIQVASGHAATRTLFSQHGAQLVEVPLWGRAVALLAGVLILAALPIGLMFIWRSCRSNALALTMGIFCLLYPLLLGLRLVPSALAIATRGMPYVFVSAGIVVAIALTGLHFSNRRLWTWQVGSITFLMVCLVGALSANALDWYLPGTYIANSYTRSVDPESIQTARWVRDYLGTGNRFAAELPNLFILGSYGEQRSVSELSDGVFVYPLFDSKILGATELSILRRGRIRYLEIDRRLGSALILSRPLTIAELRSNVPNGLTQPVVHTIFDGNPKVSRVYDDGNQLIYDVRALARAR